MITKNIEALLSGDPTEPLTDEEREVVKETIETFEQCLTWVRKGQSLALIEQAFAVELALSHLKLISKLAEEDFTQ